nr:hypothetical protein [Streptomyces sp. RFCAC02]
MPPVRLPSDEELARDALASPLMSRAIELARWAAAGVPVDADGDLADDRLASAAAALGLDGGDEGLGLAADAWHFAVDTGLVRVEEDDDGDDGAGTATTGPELELVTGGDPADVLDVWTEGFEAVLGDAATPTLEELVGGMPDLADAITEDGGIDPSAIDLDALEWDPDEEAEFLDGALASLYMLAGMDEAGQGASMIPLPMVAAAALLPEDSEELADEDVNEVMAAVLKLDDQFAALTGTGLLDHRPVDETVLTDEEAGSPDGDDDLSRYGAVRLTPLGLYAIRRRLTDAGVSAPAVGDLAGADAAALLSALPLWSGRVAREEGERWLAGRDAGEAATALLAAARGDDAGGPPRRLGCQLMLSLLGDGAEKAVRSVLDDPQLGGLARVWLADRDATDVPEPPAEMMFWLTIDSIAAHLATSDREDDEEELRKLVSALVREDEEFFDRVWATGHPATADVLDAVGRVHTDRTIAKQARRAAFKARSLG